VRTRFASVNFATSASDGDERRYARMIAAVTGSPLRVVAPPARPPDLLRVPSPRIRPGLSPVLEPIHEAFTGIADEQNTDLFMSGAGGDSVFCYLSTAAPVLDAARRRGPVAAMTALAEVARLSGSNVWTVARYALRKAMRFRARPSWPTETSFLTSEAADADPDPHPWLDAPRNALPGKREHVEAIVAIYYFLDRGFRGRDANVSYPLLAQPIVELCLRIPTWLWIRQGRNRSVARAAFEGLVPAPILSRGGKGRLESMCAEAYADSRPQLRDLLLDGRLASDGLIDRSSVEAYLRRLPERDDPRYFRIFDLATLELWQRSLEQG
jgi:asparagine synthase (glutamine-hydrolysing)